MPNPTPKPIISDYPFTEDATISYEGVGGAMVFNSLPASRWRPLKAPKKFQKAWLTQPAGIVDDDETPEFQGIYGMACNMNNICIAPAPEEITNWDTVYEIRIGLQIDNVKDWVLKDGVGNRCDEIVYHVAQSMRDIFAVALRDVGVSVKIQHLHIREDSFPYITQTATHLISNWETYQKNRPVDNITRLTSKFQGGKAMGGGACFEDQTGGLRPYSTNWSNYELGMVRGDAQYNGVLHVVAQEMFHEILSLNHTQCYRKYDNPAEPIERCFEEQCWTWDPYILPPSNEVSFLGYCYWRSGGNPPLQFGPPRGDFARIARSQVLEFGEMCLEEAHYPSCTIQPYSDPAYFLFLPLLMIGVLKWLRG